MTQSPNDQGNMHKILKMLVRSYRYMTIYTDPLGGSWVGLKELLKRLLDSASFKMSIWKFMCHYEDFTDKAFVGTTVKSAFEKAGLKPFAPQKILSKNPFYRNMLKNEAKVFRGSFERFY